jgi:hypothetical protein
MTDTDGSGGLPRWLIASVVIPLLGIGVTLYVATSGVSSAKPDSATHLSLDTSHGSSATDFNECNTTAIFLNRDSASANTIVLVGGRGFDPGERIEFSVQGSPPLATTNADSAGGFANVSVTIPSSLSHFVGDQMTVSASGQTSVCSGRATVTISG